MILFALYTFDKDENWKMYLLHQVSFLHPEIRLDWMGPELLVFSPGSKR